MGDDVYFVEVAFVPQKVVLADFCDELIEESCCYSVILFPVVSKDVQALFGVSFDVDVCGAVIEDVFELIIVLFKTYLSF